ncbi:methyltransferase-like protein 27 [Glandiceps talaboti]
MADCDGPYLAADHPAHGIGDTYDPQKMEEAFDNWSKNYDEEVKGMNYNGPKHVAESLLKLFPNKDGTILDLGCCTGLVGEELYKVGYRNIDGVDISEECIKIAKEKKVYRKIYREELSPDKEMSFQTGSYDVVVLVGAGMFLDIKGLKEWLRVTKSDGYTVLATMESETQSEEVKPTVDEYISQGLMEKIHEVTVEDYMQGKTGSLLYYRPCRK